MRQRTFSGLALCVSLLPALLVGCGASGASSQAPTLALSPGTPASLSGAPAPAYRPLGDPMYLQYHEQTNPYAQRTVARLWQVVAQADPPGQVRQARLQEASSALEQAEHAVAQANPCEGGVSQAQRQAEQLKSTLERRYLATSEQLGEEHPQARLLDAQIHLLRDEVEALEPLAKPCRDPLYGSDTAGP